MGSRLFQHLAALEESLLAQTKVLKPVDNTSIVGAARELFIRAFLSRHLGASIGIGTGDIISATNPHDKLDRQRDVVIYDTRFPKLSLGEGIDSFLIESVLCTIEVKSDLTEIEYLKSAKAGSELVNRWKMHSQDLRRPAPRRFVVAYDGPVKIDTVLGWMKKAYSSNVKQSPDLPLAELYFDGEGELRRFEHTSSSLDGVFVLGRGFILMDSFRFRFSGATDLPAIAPLRGHPIQYAMAGENNSALACMFQSLMEVIDRDELVRSYMPDLGSGVQFAAMPRPTSI